jgi:hypothetical protein
MEFTREGDFIRSFVNIDSEQPASADQRATLQAELANLIAIVEGRDADMTLSLVVSLMTTVCMVSPAPVAMADRMCQVFLQHMAAALMDDGGYARA